jgi:DNA polymerase-3 subunit delta'
MMTVTNIHLKNGLLQVRAAFKTRGMPPQDLILLDEKIASLGRETQRNFLQFCMEMFRQALL